MTRSTDTSLSSMLNDLFLLAMILVIAGILTVAMILQYRGGEIPCPLCLLRRVAMFGVFRHHRAFPAWSVRHNTGLSMLFALFLLIVAARQTLLDVYPRPGHDYVGSAVFGLHMPVWSVIIAVAILIAFAVKLAVLGEPQDDDAKSSPTLLRPRRMAELLCDRALHDQFRFSNRAMRFWRMPYLRIQIAVTARAVNSIRHRVSFCISPGAESPRPDRAGAACPSRSPGNCPRTIRHGCRPRRRACGSRYGRGTSDHG